MLVNCFVAGKKITSFRADSSRFEADGFLKLILIISTEIMSRNKQVEEEKKTFIFVECFSATLSTDSLWVVVHQESIFFRAAQKLSLGIKNSLRHKEVISSLSSCQVALLFQNNAFLVR